MTDNKPGLGSDKIDPTTKHDIQSQGGQASSSKQDMSALGQKGGSAAHPQGRGLDNTDQETREDVAHMGGQSSHSGGKRSE